MQNRAIWRERNRRASGILDVLIDDYFQRLVGYMVTDVSNEETHEIERLPQGTVFFVEVQLSKPYLGNIGYAVTCRHVLEGMRERGNGDGFIRLNRRTGVGIYDHRFSFEDWKLSQDSDVAVCRVELPPEADFWLYPIQDLARNIELGHDIFFVGLFSRLPGVDSVDALVRSGKVARKSARVLLTVNDLKQETVEATVHIVESRSWGGESGSPVFIYEQNYKLELGHRQQGFSNPFRPPPDDRVVQDIHPSLFGIMHGHYQIPVEVTNGGEKIGGIDVNSGVAVVIPCEHLTSLLMNQDLVDERKDIEDRRERRARKATNPKPDFL